MGKRVAFTEKTVPEAPKKITLLPHKMNGDRYERL